MMPYASIGQAESTLGVDEVVALTDRANTGEPDYDVLTAALVAASVEIDSYIGTRYSIPVMVEPVPLTLVSVCVDMAVYKLSRGRVVLTDETRDRYKLAVAWCKDVAAGRASVGIPTPAEGEPVAETGDVVLFNAGTSTVFARGVAGGVDDPDG